MGLSGDHSRRTETQRVVAWAAVLDGGGDAPGLFLWTTGPGDDGAEREDQGDDSEDADLAVVVQHVDAVCEICPERRANYSTGVAGEQNQLRRLRGRTGRLSIAPRIAARPRRSH